MNPELEETIVIDFITSRPATRAAVNADTLPTAWVYEDGNDTPMLLPDVALRSGTTGNYRITIPCTAANGFEAGKSYNVVVAATVGSITAKAVVKNFQMRAYGPDDVASTATATAIARLSSNLARRTVSFKSVLEGVATRMGLEPGANLQANQAAALCEYIMDRLQKAWELAAWPEWTTCEERQFRADYENDITYGVGDEVYDPSQDAYYRSLNSPNFGHPTSDTFYWEEASDLDTFIDFEQPWEANPLGIVWGVYREDPRKNERPRPLGWWISPDGVWVQAGGFNKVWMEYSYRAPQFTTVLWSAAASYLAEDLTYYPATGECYQAMTTVAPGTLPTDTTAWAKQDFPRILARHVKFAAAADALREDENLDKADGWDTQAAIALNEALDRANPAMRTQPSFSVQGR